MVLAATIMQYAIPALMAAMSGTKGGREFLGGKPEQQQQMPLFNEEQMQSFSSLMKDRGDMSPSPLYGGATDYLSGIFSDSDKGASALEAPAMRQFQEQIMPAIAQQFATMGAGALSGSGFQQASAAAGGSLAEKMAAMKENRKMQALGPALNFSQMPMQQQQQDFMQQLQLLGVRPFENQMRPETGGLLGGMAPGIGQGIGSGLTKLMFG